MNFNVYIFVRIYFNTFFTFIFSISFFSSWSSWRCWLEEFWAMYSEKRLSWQWNRKCIPPWNSMARVIKWQEHGTQHKIAWNVAVLKPSATGVLSYHTRAAKKSTALADLANHAKTIHHSRMSTIEDVMRSVHSSSKIVPLLLDSRVSSWPFSWFLEWFSAACSSTWSNDLHSSDSFAFVVAIVSHYVKMCTL